MGRGEYYRNKYGRGGGRGGRGRGAATPRDEDDYSHRRRRGESPADGRRERPLRTWQQLAALLRDLDNRNYPAYHDLEHALYVYEDPASGSTFTLGFDHIQGDPFASPSRAHVAVAPAAARFPSEMVASKIRNIALCDYLTRQFADSARRAGADAKTRSSSWHGAKGGDMTIDTPGQHVIERSSVMVDASGAVEARFQINLPARGRSICGNWACTILVDVLPRLVGEALVFPSLNAAHVWSHLHSVEDQEALRRMLPAAGLVGFVRNGAILPRESGASDRPLSKDKAVLFQSPPSLERTFQLPNAGEIRGMGVPAGVTLFVGGGFHGKTTILKALEVGVYNHIPGDGREFVVLDANAVKIRAEDSRSVVSCDISAFIDNLPFKQDTTAFTTADASGSTSQAANIIEALEMGATTLVIDEDTCATNFMIRDGKMQQLVAKDKEPITPFIAKVRAMYETLGVSSVLVIGGAGDYFSVADHVIMMDSYSPRDVTAQAKAIAKEHGEVQQDTTFGGFRPRIPLNRGFDVTGKVVSRGLNRIQYGDVDLDLSAVEQLVEPSQVRAIADAIATVRSLMNGQRTLKVSGHITPRDDFIT
ncbi:hypothetical protein P43SY_006081 [Pythium insidiosum]|uniref:ATPase of the ABC class n=1 Tax=Pythium insidiosum TaxID=114742 RepID=A0AAD5LSE5_PYTIN|nr:hypothetical protein P43SY_006081 [Pythium insidiosum]